MSQVGVVADGTSCLPAELARKYGIAIAPLIMNINGKSYVDIVDMTNEKFWEMFNSNAIKQFGTSQAAGQFVHAFRETARSADNIVCIVISKLLSAAYDAATEAREVVKRDFPNLKIEIVDTKSACGVELFAALEAARASQAGKSLPEVVQVAQDISSRAKLLFSLETLKYIIKSGRAPKAAWAGEMLRVRPILGITNGSGVVESIARVRTKKKSVEKMVDMVGQYCDVNKPLHMAVHYTDSREAGEELKEVVTSRYNCVEVHLSPFTVAMCGQAGPLLGLSFYSE